MKNMTLKEFKEFMVDNNGLIFTVEDSEILEHYVFSNVDGESGMLELWFEIPEKEIGRYSTTLFNYKSALSLFIEHSRDDLANTVGLGQETSENLKYLLQCIAYSNKYKKL